MTSFINDVFSYLEERTYSKYALIASIISFLLTWVFSIFHYTNIYYGNKFSWIFWIISIVLFLYSFLPPRKTKQAFSFINTSNVLIFLIIFLVYWMSHLWNFSTSPWNQNGLFDDAAWDIYFAKNKVFSDAPFQAAFFDEVGYISREVVFHYYISTFFKLFGYDLLVFNLSLLVLGFITVLFTTLIIHKLFKNIFVTLLSALIVNFFPVLYMNISRGDRYAITAPLMTISLYFLYSSFKNHSFVRALLSALFAALCWDSAIMGKQYILGVALSVVFIIIFDKKRLKSKENISVSLIWIASFIISATPLLAYILFNYDSYITREKGILREFLTLFRQGGFPAIKPYVDKVIELFFANHTFLRQFVADYYIIPLPYYLLFIPGTVLVLTKKRFEIIFLSLIPVFGALLSGPYDYRVILAAPFWIICIAYSLNHVFGSESLNQNSIKSYLLMAISFFCILAGLITSSSYILKVSNNPNYQHFLPHKDVAVSRLVQDIVVGAENPKIDMKQDELNRKINPHSISHDTLVCPLGSYAIMHLYLQNYDDKKILSFCDQGIQLLQTPNEILKNNLNAIIKYQTTGKDLKLIWEVSEKSEKIIDAFSKYKNFGSEETLSDSVDGSAFSLYILTITNENITRFQKAIEDDLSIKALLNNQES